MPSPLFVGPLASPEPLASHGPWEPDARTPVYGPADLPGVTEGHAAQVGGRVLQREGHDVVVADADGQCKVRLAEVDPAAKLAVGCIAVFSGNVTHGEQGPCLDAAQIAYCQPVDDAWERAPALRRVLFGGLGARLRQAAQVKRVIRSYFEAQGFVEVDTPTLTCFPGTDPFIEPVRAGEHQWLVTSPESHMKQLLAAGMPQLFQLRPCFRQEERGPLHRTEFQLLEWYRSFASWTEVLDDTESLLCAIATAVRGEAAFSYQSRRIPLTRPFERLSVRTAFQRYAGIADASVLAAEDEGRFFDLLVSAVEPALAQHPGPVVLHDYPVALGALARPTARDASVVERFEIYAAGVELCNGYGELTCPATQAVRFRADVERRQQRGQPALPIDQPLLAALGGGLPPAAGNALGLERVLMLACGVQSLDEVAAFSDDEADRNE